MRGAEVATTDSIEKTVCNGIIGRKKEGVSKWKQERERTEDSWGVLENRGVASREWKVVISKRI